MDLYYEGGPRDGQTLPYNGDMLPHGPKTVGCVTEAMAKGMFGFYKRDRIVNGMSIMVWKDMRPEPGKRKG